MNKKLVVLAAVALFIIAVTAPLSNQLVSVNSFECNTKCLLDNLQKPAVNGNFTFFSEALSLEYRITIGGGITNYGTRTALSVNMTLYWTINQNFGGLVKEQLGTFHLGDISGRNTHPFILIKSFNQIPPPFNIVNVNATYQWGGA